MKETPRAKLLRQAGVLKYGSVEAWSEAMRAHGAKAKRTGSGGFASKKLGSDGLTGVERAAKFGKINGKLSPHAER